MSARIPVKHLHIPITLPQAVSHRRDLEESSADVGSSSVVAGWNRWSTVRMRVAVWN